MAQLNATTITGTLTTNGAASVSLALTVGQDATVDGSQTVGGTLIVTGQVTAPTLLLTGAATLSGHAMRKGEVDSAIAAVNSAISGLGTVYQPLDSDLTAIAALATTSFGRGLLTAADAPGLRSTAGLVIGTNVQAYDGTLAGLAGKTVVGSGNVVLQSYVDSISAGLKTKNKVRLASTANGVLATAFANGQTVDGVVLATGDRLLLKNQTAPAENGVYVVAASGAPVRADDWDEWAEIIGALVAVEEGTAQHDTLWISTADQGGTLGTTAITFSNPFALALLASNNLSDVANAVTALSNLGGASRSRTITGGGLASGGGDLTADRTITVPAATQAEAEAGTDDATAMTPLKTAQAIAALAGGGGATQLPQWVYEVGGGDPSGVGKFTQAGSDFKINKTALAGYDATVLVSNWTTGDLIVFTAADGGVSVIQTGPPQSASGDNYDFGSVSTYGEAFSAGTYSVSVCSSAAVASVALTAANAATVAAAAAAAAASSTAVTASIAGTNGILKGDGAGGVSAAVAATDYVAPGGVGTMGVDSGWQTSFAGDKTVSLMEYNETDLTDSGTFPDFDSARTELTNMQGQVFQLNNVVGALIVALRAKVVPNA